MSVLTFISKYADEAFATAKALSALLEGVAIRPDQADKVNDAIAKLETAAGNIAKSKPVVIKVEAKDIEAAVAKYLNKNLNKLIAKALADEKANSNGA